MALPWFRFYSEALSDKKLQLIASRTGTSRMEVVGVWASLMCIASESPERGSLYIADGDAYTPEDLAVTLDMTRDALAPILREMERMHIIAWQDGVCILLNWAKRQPDSDASVTRTRSWRDRHETVTAPSQHRHSDGDVTPPDNRQQIVVVAGMDVVTQLKTFGVEGTPLDELADCEPGVVSATLRYAADNGLGAGWVVKELRKRKPAGPTKAPPRKMRRNGDNAHPRDRGDIFCPRCHQYPCMCEVNRAQAS